MVCVIMAVMAVQYVSHPFTFQMPSALFRDAIRHQAERPFTRSGIPVPGGSSDRLQPRSFGQEWKYLGHKHISGEGKIMLLVTQPRTKKVQKYL